jgi:CDP-glucose 4,6-dehydratase
VPTLNYEQLVAFTGSWYFSFYKDQENMLDFTLAQIRKYEQIAISKENQWTK